MTRSATLRRVVDDAWQPGPTKITLGVDIVELVSSAMYVHPFTAYREYVQNALDALDEARANSVLRRGDQARIDISIEPAARVVRIRDNGTGIASRDFVPRLTALGGSAKRGKNYRGFRGVGRLAALGYCQELIFRSRSLGEPVINELRWDCRELRSILRSADFAGSLEDAVARCTSYRSRPTAEPSQHFFEVELRGIVRHGNDELLNDQAVARYLEQIAPLSFRPTFPHAHAIHEFLSERVSEADTAIYVNGSGPLHRLHDATITIRDSVASATTDVEFVEIPGVDGVPAAAGWVLHHEYRGAIPREAGLRGIRLRSGGLQVGDDSILDEVFPESRFNAWSVGEFHILDERIIPNGRRDCFERNVHFENVLNYLGPVARAISNRCRSQSLARRKLRDSERLLTSAKSNLALVQQGGVSRTFRQTLLDDAAEFLAQLKKIVESPALPSDDRSRLRRRHDALSRRLMRMSATDVVARGLLRMAPARRRIYQDVFATIYECTNDQAAAKQLVDDVLQRLSKRQ